jgi:energy-coupling factor transporter ATP-binding protein EcfA2
MSTASETPSIEEQLVTWLKGQRSWLQHAAVIVLQGEGVSGEGLDELADRAIADAKGQSLPPPASFPLAVIGTRGGGSVVLKSISGVAGIGKLNPRRPLEFAPTGITAVYGTNGSGKSSYVRTLKHVCGARVPGKLYGDVFAGANPDPSCKITFVDEQGEATAQWSQQQGPVERLSTVDIFDTTSGQSYLKDQSPPRYEPRVMGFMGDLAQLVKMVGAKLASSEAALLSQLPAIPQDLGQTEVGTWYRQINASTEQDAIDIVCDWTPEVEEEWVELGKQLAEASPVERAKEQRARKALLDGLSVDLATHHGWYSDAAFGAIITLRNTAKAKREAAELAAKLLQDARLGGVGSQPWVELWGHARSYSQQQAYPGITFPNVTDDALCVLCHQQLDDDAKKRLVSFEQFVADKASQAAAQAKTALDRTLSQLPQLPDDEDLRRKAHAAGLPDYAVEQLVGFYTPLRKRRVQFGTIEDAALLETVMDIAEWRQRAKATSEKYENEAIAFSLAEEQRQAKLKRYLDLNAYRWIAAQKPAIITEVDRKKQLALLEKARSFCNPRGISIQAGVLAEQVVTPLYIDAFNAELKALRAGGISVEMKRTGADQGSILHQVRLLGVEDPKLTQEVLSEGEHRVVSLAAFLADSAGNPNGSTFIFDDPISSLDIDFEEAVVQRLVDLSLTRQVIVFTHRLSLLGLLHDYAKKKEKKVKVIHVRREPWGAGEPGDETIESAPLKSILNEHLPARARKAKQVYEEHGTVEYNILAQSICTETRKVVERLVEVELFNDVILRHRRQIKTDGKLDKVARIRPEDCSTIDGFMTKYSRYEHAQTGEAPVPPPLPDELLDDLQRLKAWRDEFVALRG